MPDQQLEVNLLEVTSRIATAHVSNNTVAPADLPRLIITVHQALTDLGEKPLSPAAPAVPIKRSVRPDYIICLDDGKKFKMLKGHLGTAHNMSPEEYRRNGTCHLTIRWWLRNMPSIAASCRRSSVLVGSGEGTPGVVGQPRDNLARPAPTCWPIAATRSTTYTRKPMPKLPGAVSGAASS